MRRLKQSLKVKTMMTLQIRNSAKLVDELDSASELSANMSVVQSVAGEFSTVSSMKKQLLVKHAASAFEPGIANEVESEIACYINCKSTDDNPLELWRPNESNFKNLSLLAKTYLCASAASVPVEQMFSSTGLMLLFYGTLQN